MPSKKTAPAKKAAPAPSSAESEPTDATDETADTAGETPEGTEEQPLNRAERRAKGKTATASQPTFRGKVVGGHGPASTQRMWSNRRSGG